MKHIKELKKSLTNKRRTIYVDMDGVVADFNLYVSNLIGREIGWGVHDLTSDEWNRIGEVPNLYRHLPLIEESVEMVELCKSFQPLVNVEFLSAIPRKSTMPSASQDKIDWVAEYFPGMVVNFGPYSVDKQYWARPGDILIDDKPSNIEQWGKAGGIPIHHYGDFRMTKQLILYAMDAIDQITIDQPA